MALSIHLGLQQLKLAPEIFNVYKFIYLMKLVACHKYIPQFPFLVAVPCTRIRDKCHVKCSALYFKWKNLPMSS